MSLSPHLFQSGHTDSPEVNGWWWEWVEVDGGKGGGGEEGGVRSRDR